MRHNHEPYQLWHKTPTAQNHLRLLEGTRSAEEADRLEFDLATETDLKLEDRFGADRNWLTTETKVMVRETEASLTFSIS